MMVTEVLSHQHRSPLMAGKKQATSKTTFLVDTPINQNHRHTDIQIPLAAKHSSPPSQTALRSSDTEEIDTKKRNLPSPRRLASLSIKSGLSRLVCDFSGGSSREFEDDNADMTLLELELERNRRNQESKSTREDDEWDSTHRSCWEAFKQQYVNSSCDGSADHAVSFETPINRSDTASSSRSSSPLNRSTENRVLSNDVRGSRCSRSNKPNRTTRRSTSMRKQTSVPDLNGDEAGRPPLFALGDKSASFRGYPGARSLKKTYRKNRLVWKYSSPEEDHRQEAKEEMDAASTTPETSIRSASSYIDYSDDDLLKENDPRLDDVSVDFVVSSRATSPARVRAPSPLPSGRSRTPPPPLLTISTDVTSSPGSTGSRSPPPKQRRTSAKPKLRFADEIGIPIAEVHYVQTEFSTEEVHSVRRIMVLLLSPAHRRFELIHVSYQQQFQHRMTIAEVVEQIAPMATDKKLRRQHYTGLACRRKDPKTKKIHAEELLNTLCIQDYELVKNEVLVALVKGYKSKELMNMAEALLRNKKVLRAVKLGTANKQAVQKLESAASDGVDAPTEGTLTSPNANRKHKESFGERYPKKMLDSDEDKDRPEDNDMELEEGQGLAEF